MVSEKSNSVLLGSNSWKEEIRMNGRRETKRKIQALGFSDGGIRKLKCDGMDENTSQCLLVASWSHNIIMQIPLFVCTEYLILSKKIHALQVPTLPRC